MKTGYEKQIQGIKKAIDHAEMVHQNWSIQAMNLLFQFCQKQRMPFMTEEFRKFCIEKELPEPPSLRSFGGIILRASKMGLITSIGTRKVINPKAHCANANLWLVNQN
jgi:hypothetical protein